VSEVDFRSGMGPIFLDQLNCGPTDNTLLGCSRLSPLGLPRCGHEGDVGVHCEGIYLLCNRYDIWVVRVGIGVCVCACMLLMVYLVLSEVRLFSGLSLL